jgi:hypothetical protein
MRIFFNVSKIISVGRYITKRMHAVISFYNLSIIISNLNVIGLLAHLGLAV